MSECACSVPEPTTDRLNGQPNCLRCGRVLGEAWLSSDEKLDDFFDALELWGDRPTLESLRYLCHAREQEGRAAFKLQYLGRDNTKAADEEGADGVIYSYLETLKNRRAGDPETDDIELYHAAHAFSKAYEHLARYRLRKRGH